MISQKEFLHLPSVEVAKLVCAAGPQVCVFPLNGSRRWFMLEYKPDQKEDLAQAYITIAEKRQLELYRMCFEHGLETLVSPIFGSKHLLRSNDYMAKIGADGMSRLATHPEVLSFYNDYKIRVRFYGNYRKELTGTPFAYLIEQFEQLTRQTADNDGYRLFYGVFANDATEAIAEFSVQHFQQTGRVPNRQELVEGYYGEYIEAASLFIGFSKPRVYDYPLLGLGAEDLYFTFAPSLYMNDEQLRHILYDHLYSRRIEQEDYAKMTEQDFAFMREFYQTQRSRAMGVGELKGGIWYPAL